MSSAIQDLPRCSELRPRLRLNLERVARAPSLARSASRDLVDLSERGCGVLLQIADVPFLLSCAHVLKVASEKDARRGA